MRVAYLGVGHWHTGLYLDPLLDRSDTRIVGVADPSPEATDPWASASGAPAFADYREMCERVQPDLVFALGRPADMAAEAEYLIETGIPFVMEKPCGVNVAEIERIAGLARDRGAFASVPLAYRSSRLVDLIREVTPGSELVYASFKAFAGLPRRYHVSNVGWNLDPAVAGGGCTLNLGVHFFDLLRVLAPSAPWAVTGASMSSELSGEAVEDFSAVLLESGGRRAVVETGYVFPGPEVLDISFSICIGDDYFRCEGTNRLHVSRGKVLRENTPGSPQAPAPWRQGGSVHDNGFQLAELGDVGQATIHELDTTPVSSYRSFVEDTIDRVASGRPPLAGLDDMLEAAKLAERAYRLAGSSTGMA